ncbi:MAG: response regulator [Acidobacteria bacterium]|nr:response regulator [Acidobacteriota bacterium]
MKSLKKALEIFLNEAYKGEKLPDVVANLADSVSGVKRFSELFRIQGVESPAEGVASVRLGNRLYPHMKLVVRKEGDRLHFAVDTHDGPDRIPPSLPGYERFKPVIQENERIRETVQRRLAREFHDIGHEGQTQPSRGCVLVVDDESFVRDIMTRLLTSFGFETLSAECADVGLEFVRNKHVSFCFLDIMMPGKSGYQFIEELEAEGLRKFPIVFLTGMHPKHIREEVADGLILKPFTASMLKGQFSRFGLI